MKLLIAIGLLFLSARLAYGQAGHATTGGKMSPTHPVVVPSRYSYYNPIVYQLHDGTARLTDGTLRQGRFLYNKGAAFIYYHNGHDDRQRIYFLQFERLALAGADTSVTPRLDSTIFLNVKNHLLRRLTVGKIGLYDDTYSVDENKNKIGKILFTWSDDGKLKRLRTLEKTNKWFFEVCQQNHWPNPDVFLSKKEIIKRLAQYDPVQ